MQKKLNSKPILPTDDHFTEAFEEFSKTKLAARLNEKFRLKPYYEKYKNINVSALTFGYLCNFLSALTASALVFFFVKEVIAGKLGSMPAFWIGLIVAICFAILLENKKRQTLSIFFTDLYQFNKFRAGLAVAILAIYGISISFSFFGGQRSIVELTPPPELMNKDSMENALLAQITLINDQIKKAENTKWKGTTTTRSQDAKKSLVAERLMINKRLLSIQESTENKNGVILVEHESRVKLSAWNFALCTLALEILFFFSISYTEFYDYRTQAEMSKIASMNQDQTQSVAMNQTVPIVTGQSGLSQAGPALSQSVTGLTQESLVTDGGQRLLDQMKDQIDLVTDEQKKIELKSYRRKAQKARSRLMTGEGRVDTSIKNIDRAIQDFESSVGQKLFS